MATASYRLGVDIGGTFTDIVLVDDGGVFSKKVLSTPRDYSEAIEHGVAALLAELRVEPQAITEFVHATTVATNAIIERKGVKTALVTTRGFRDVLELGRFRSPRLYDLSFRKPEPLIPRDLRFELTERVTASGEVLEAVNEGELAELARDIAQRDVQAVAVTFINAYVNPVNELRAAEQLAQALPGISVSVSARLLPQIGEYERTSTTVVNAYIRPVIERYVGSLRARLERLRIAAPLMIMQSSGGIAPGAAIAEKPIYIIESGPAAGVLGSQRVAERAGVADLIVFDMGGTTAKATIIEGGRVGLCPETEVGGGAALGNRMIRGSGFPVQVPTIDIAEVGAGGGSIASLDAAGGIQVGPRSAGAEPGPVCYDRGGTEPTVTDANLLLGYLNPSALVGGDLALNYGKAERAVKALAGRLGIGEVDAAYGIHLIANATMLRALRGVSSEKGMDPSAFALFAIGGNGPVHAITLAEEAGMTRIVVPPVAGLFSALGMLFADVEHQLIAGFYRRFSAVTPADLNAAASPLVAEGVALLSSEGFTDATRRDIVVYADVKYVGQTSPLPVALSRFPADAESFAEIGAAFAAEHRKIFGYESPGEPLQFVSIKAQCRGVPLTARMPEHMARRNEPSVARTVRRAYFGPQHGWQQAAIVTRASLREHPLAGPAIVEEYDTTTVVYPGWRAGLDALNNIRIAKG